MGKQKTKFLDRLKTQQEDLQALKEAFDDLHQKHAELSLQAKSHEQHIHEMEVCIPKTHVGGLQVSCEAGVTDGYRGWGAVLDCDVYK